MQQQIITAENNYEQLDSWIRGTGAGTVMLVCDSSLQFLEIRHYFDSAESRLGISLVRFTDIVPNPSYESVVEGVSLFNSTGCGAIIAVGGGSSMDVAKCIKLYSNMDPAINYLKQEIGVSSKDIRTLQKNYLTPAKK